MNIESIGGWNVWFLVFFFLLSQSVIVHHLREISKSLRSQRSVENMEDVQNEIDAAIEAASAGSQCDE